VVERFKLVDGGKTLQILIEVEDPRCVHQQVARRAALQALDGRPDGAERLRGEQFRLFHLQGRADSPKPEKPDF
jgi:hypothetical protein